MKRRDLLQLAALSGLAVMSPARRARAEASSWAGPFWVSVHASGGWDPTSFCDPKGGTRGDKASVNQAFTPDAILTSGAFRVAPTALNIDLGGGNLFEVYSAKRFFDAHGSRFVLFNGVDTATNNHDTGARVVLAGRSNEGYPNIAAYAAATAYETAPVPMAYLSYGGYDGTGGGVPLTRASNIDNLWRVAYPNRVDPKKEDSREYLPASAFNRVQAAQNARMQRLTASEPMPAVRRAISTLFASRSGDSGLAAVSQYLPAKAVTIDDIPDLAVLPGDKRGQLGSIENFCRQAQLAVAAFQGGVGIGASLVMGGFDTHNDHDNGHIPQLMRLLRGISYLIEQATAAGIADKLYIVVGSDFGRTPYYNAGNGKDHWAVTSMLVSGPGIAGGRVIGSTDEGYRPVPVNPTTLLPDPNGIRIRPEQIHAALRQKAGLLTGAMAQRYPVTSVTPPFFG